MTAGVAAGLAAGTGCGFAEAGADLAGGTFEAGLTTGLTVFEAGFGGILPTLGFFDACELCFSLSESFPLESRSSETLSVLGPCTPVFAIRSSTSRILPRAPVKGSESGCSLPFLAFSIRSRSRSAARREIIAARAAISR
ncbi:MAG TPA: hypothetical protein DCY59_10300 [Micrococcaceae bacterium]|nr:hypothetical protein [Micrococcaceae bacterium]